MSDVPTFPVPDWDAQREAERTWRRALDEARDRSDPKVVQYREWMNSQRRRAGEPELSYEPPPEITALADCADRVGLTAEIWSDVKHFRWSLEAFTRHTYDRDDMWRYVHRVGEYANVWRPSR